MLNAGLVPGKDLQHNADGVELAAAASVVGHLDTQSGLLTREVLKAALSASGVDNGALEWDAGPEQLR
ncbi:MAG: hypothetical protein KTR21_07215 [Rhodobacteraceae bacterium]|nr:hypothetical protein [Paracoccaceae bacterium]